MPAQTTASLSDNVRTQYVNDYLKYSGKIYNSIELHPVMCSTDCAPYEIYHPTEPRYTKRCEYCTVIGEGYLCEHCGAPK